MDGVTLEFEDNAVSAIAKLALERETGARGLRTIVEDIMLDVMYEVPSDPSISKVMITEGCVAKRTKPKLSYRTEEDDTLPQKHVG